MATKLRRIWRRLGCALNGHRVAMKVYPVLPGQLGPSLLAAECRCSRCDKALAVTTFWITVSGEVQDPHTVAA